MIEIIAEQTYHITGRGQCIVFSMQTNNLTQSTLPKQGEKITWKGATYKDLDVVKVVNFPVNYPHLWNQTGTVVCVYERHPHHFLVEFDDETMETLHESYLQIVWRLDDR